MKAEVAKSPPPRSHTLHVTSTSAPSNTRLQRTPLPSVSTTPSLSPRPSLRSPARSALNAGRPEADSKLDKRGVRWIDGRNDKAKEGNSLRRERTSEAAQMWARYTQTVLPKFTLYEPRSNGNWRLHGKRHGESDEDGRCFLKLALPCVTECNLCVYSRQLGPVRVYFTTAKPPNKLLRSGNGSRRGKNHLHPHDNSHSEDVDDVLERGDHCGERSTRTSQEVLVIPQITVAPAEDIHGRHNGRGFESSKENRPEFSNSKQKSFHSSRGSARVKDGWVRHSTPAYHHNHHHHHHPSPSQYLSERNGFQFQERKNILPHQLNISNSSGNTKTAHFSVRRSCLSSTQTTTQTHGKSLSYRLPKLAWDERSDVGRKGRSGEEDSSLFLYRNGVLPPAFKNSQVGCGSRHLPGAVPGTFPARKRTVQGRVHFA